MSLEMGLLPDRGTNIVLIGGAVLGGLWLPAVPFVSRLVLPTVSFLIYVSLRGTQARELFESVRLHHVGTGLAVTYLLLPVGSFILGQFVTDGSVRTGLFITAAIPVTAGSSIVWTRLSNGDTKLASVVSISSILLAPVVTPLLLSALVGSTVSLALTPIVENLVVIIGGGVALRAVLPNDAFSDSQVERASQAAIVFLVYASVSQLDIEAAGSLPSLLSVFLPVVILLLFGSSASLLLSRAVGFSQSTESAIFFSGGLKNLGVGLFLVDVMAVPSATVVVITYYLVQQVVGAVTADLFFGGKHLTQSMASP